MKHKVTAIAVSAAIALTPISPLLAQSDSIATDAVAESWIPATQDEQEEARGGVAWVVAWAGAAQASALVIRYCGGSRVEACVGAVKGVIYVSKNYKDVTRWTCKKFRRFC